MPVNIPSARTERIRKRHHYDLVPGHSLHGGRWLAGSITLALITVAALLWLRP